MIAWALHLMTSTKLTISWYYLSLALKLIFLPSLFLPPPPHHDIQQD